VDRGQTEAAVRMGKITAGLKLLVFAKFKISKIFSASAWRLKSRQNKKRIAQFACKSQDESNELNYAVIRR